MDLDAINAVVRTFCRLIAGGFQDRPAYGTMANVQPNLQVPPARGDFIFHIFLVIVRTVLHISPWNQDKVR